ncbi:hypothetical protein PEC730217_01370 [Pectobacterium carotovorum subsp. carotovorum]|nr:hypothetical protein PEC730217_01370 [Pectobacterium carotovorum subsp. carotovorum]
MIGLDILTPDYVNTRHNKTGRHLSIVAPFLCCFTSFIWLGYEDSNLGMPESESVAWPNEINQLH